MKERPILFSAPMVRALLDGSKTQTRRIVKGAALDWLDIAKFDSSFSSMAENSLCLYGLVGDRLWVRETYRFLDNFDGDSPSAVGELCINAGYSKPWAPIKYDADGATDNWMQVGTPTHTETPPKPGKLRPSIHMPRWASRILLEITGVRVERLQDISEADAQAEGSECLVFDNCTKADRKFFDFPLMENGSPYRNGYALLWESINGTGSWEENPWVWVIEFWRVTA